MLMFILSYNGPALLMLGEQPCQKRARLGCPCVSREIKHFLSHQPKFRGLSFTHSAEMEKKKAPQHSRQKHLHIAEI